MAEEKIVDPRFPEEELSTNPHEVMGTNSTWGQAPMSQDEAAVHEEAVDADEVAAEAEAAAEAETEEPAKATTTTTTTGSSPQIVTKVTSGDKGKASNEEPA